MNLLKHENSLFYHPIYNRFSDKGLSVLKKVQPREAKGWYTVVEEEAYHPRVYDESGEMVSSGVRLEDAITRVKSHYVKRFFDIIIPTTIEVVGFEVWEKGISYDGDLYNLIDELKRDNFIKLYTKSEHIDDLDVSITDTKSQEKVTLPRVVIQCETTSERDGVRIIGSTSLNVIRVEIQDDGTIVAVTDHWPREPLVLKGSDSKPPLDDTIREAFSEAQRLTQENFSSALKDIQIEEDTSFKETYSADPFAKVKLAKAEGKEIFWRTSIGKWASCPNPTWNYPLNTYGVGDHHKGKIIRADEL